MARRKKKIGIIDADLVGRQKHRFPNLVCEKISAYWNEKGAHTELLLSYENLNDYDEVYISKVFTDTPCPDELYDEKWLKNHPHIHIGGTGFYFDKAPNLPDEIEHHMPNYHLYDSWIENEVKKAREKWNATQALIHNNVNDFKPFNEKNFLVQFKEYQEYSIGFLTRGCFRKCGFCVNQKYDHVFVHSPLDEFYDPAMKKICMLDDNFFGCPHWKTMLEELIRTGKSFKFKQGLDERLLTPEKCELLFNSKYDGDFTFAFDKISDYELIESKLQMIRKTTDFTRIKFYVLVGFDSVDSKDIENAFKRIELLFKYQCLPYIMRYQNKNETPWKDSEYRGLYVTLARWANQPSIVKKMSFRQFCEANQELHKTKGTYCNAMKSLIEFENMHPEIAKKYFDMRFEEMKVY